MPGVDGNIPIGGLVGHYFPLLTELWLQILIENMAEGRIIPIADPLELFVRVVGKDTDDYIED